MWLKLLIVWVLVPAPWAWADDHLLATQKSGALIAQATPYQNNEDNAAVASEVRPGARRIALVIGNASYSNDPLQNPVDDARSMSKTLGMLGFNVLRYENLTQQRMKDALLEFNRQLADGGVGLFYFSGHGFRTPHKTLLAPIDADRHSPAHLLTHSIDLQIVLDSMSKPRPDKLNLVILDTCLNNPFQSGDGGVGDAPAQTLIAYAAAPGSIATDDAHHGLYTTALLNAMIIPRQDIGEMFQRVASAVSQASNQRQLPWVSSALPGKFRFIPENHRTSTISGPVSTRSAATWPAAAQPTAMLALQGRGILPKDSAEQYELTFWESIKESTHASDYQAYLQAYPNGRFAGLARARIERLRAATPKAETPAAKEPPARARPAAPVQKAAPEQARPSPATPPAPATASPAAAPPPQASPAAAATPGELKNCPTCPVMIALAPGSFTMGNNASDPSEKPAHKVAISTAFAIGKYEVTVAQWKACEDAGTCPRVTSDADRANLNAPMRNVSWDDAQQYVKWLSTTSGKPYRLPTEAEWEYAARGGTSTRYWWGEQMRTGKANCKDCGQPWHADGPVNVGSFAANPYGLYDMNGSVWEWTSDCWHTSFKNAPADARTWDEANCRARVIRGGSWREGESYMLSSTRFKYDASVRNSQNGFRVVSDIK